MDVKKILKWKRNLLIGGVAIATLITLTGCGKKDDNKTKTYDKENVAVQNVVDNTANGVSENKNETNQQNNESVSKELLKDSSKEIVYAYVNDAKTWTETSVNGDYEVGYSYKIPQINIDSTDAEKINRKIQDEYMEAYTQGKEYNGAGCSKIEYAYHINGDIVSVVIASFWDGGSAGRTAYNINSKTGKEVTNSELLSKKGITEADFPSKLSKILAEKLKGMYTPSEEQLSYSGSAEFYNTQYKRTTALENCSVNNDMYLNANNQLCVITTRYNIAGGDATEIIVNIDTNDIYVQE